ncbi:MAG: hypothetical protein ABSB68_01140 [Acidimicrobiales bacterium]|jgi:hypothetical protein
MRGPDNLNVAAVRRWRWRVPALAVLPLALFLAGCSAGGHSDGALADPSHSVSPTPNYTDVCAPIGADTSSPCLRITLEAIDGARAAEGLRPMRLPADFAQLTIPEQVFVAVDSERVDRGLVPFTGLTTALDGEAQKGADAARLPPRPGAAYAAVDTEWIGAIDNGLDADFQWMYDDGPNSGVPDCSTGKTSGCWADRRIVLDRFGSRHLVMGAAFDPAGDTSPGDKGGSSLAATFAASTSRAGAYSYSWKQAEAAMAAGTLRPLRSIPSSESDTGISDPRGNVPPVPDYTRVCASGLDDSPACIEAALAAINHAHSLEGIRSMVLPSGFAQMSVPDQLFVVVNLERVDRGLPPFRGLTAALDQNAQRGADSANDPPDPGRAYVLDDAEWAGGSSNGLDADYGWMYDDGFDSGNLDCLRRGAAGCWGHRKGILDDFGSGANLVMGAAVDTKGDTHRGDAGGTSMAVTLAVADAPARSFTYDWTQVLAAMPPGSD